MMFGVDWVGWLILFIIFITLLGLFAHNDIENK